VNVLAFDVGGTQLRSALVDASGALSSRRRTATPAHDPAALLARLVDEARAHTAGSGASPAAIGLALAGMVEPRAGQVRFAPSVGLIEVPLGLQLADALQCPVRLVNDVNAAAVAEASVRGAADLVALFIGTGVGAGWLSSGTVVEGHHGMAAEGGHIPFRPDGPRCPAGHVGCIEAYLGGASLAARARDAGLPPTTAGLVQAWREGDPRAVPILDDACAALSTLLVTLVTLLDPQTIVLGGGVLAGTPELLDVARAALSRHPLVESAGPVPVQEARCGDDAGLLGAAQLARQLIASD
jgi:glucokinase